MNLCEHCGEGLGMSWVPTRFAAELWFKPEDMICSYCQTKLRTLLYAADMLESAKQPYDQDGDLT